MKGLRPVGRVVGRSRSERLENFLIPSADRKARQLCVFQCRQFALVFGVKDVNHFPGVFLISNPVSRLRAIKF